MTQVIEFPRMFWEADHDWNIVGNSATSGVTTVSAVSVRSDGGGFWSASLNNIRFLDRSYTLLWRAIRQACNGGVNPIVVYRRDCTWAPFPPGTAAFDGIPHSDGTLFSDETGYYQPIIDVATYDDAPLRGTTLGLRFINCGGLVGGESFSINHPIVGWRLYEVATVDYADADHAIVTFNPPLREAVPEGTVIEFDRPCCTMRLTTAKAMDLNTTTYPFSLASVQFIESVW